VSWQKFAKSLGKSQWLAIMFPMQTIRPNVAFCLICKIVAFGLNLKIVGLAFVKIKLESSAGTGHFYTTTKNKRTKPEKMEIMKFDPKVRKHVAYKETKIK